jgi:excisionase family DNA binding protein
LADQSSASTGAVNLSGRPPRLLTVAQAAAFLTLKESTLRDYARRHVVPSIRIGRHMRFVEDDLIGYLDELRRVDEGVVGGSRRRRPA